MRTKQKSQSKAIVALSAVIALLAILSITLTFAYFTDSKGTTSDQGLTFDTLTLNVTEGDWSITQSETEKESLTTIVPGCEITMAGKVALTGASAYLKVEFKVEGEGRTIPPTEEGGQPTQVTLDSVATDAIKSALGQALTGKMPEEQTDEVAWKAGLDWQEIDGVWYCVVSKSAADNVIDFTDKTVTIPLVQTGNLWQGATVKIGYTVSAIQSAHVTLSGSDNTAKAVALQTLFNSVDMGTGVEKNSTGD